MGLVAVNRSPMKRKAPTPIPAKIRFQVLARDRYRCRWCAATGPLELHHVRKRSQGRDDKPENLLTLCRFCHERTDRPYRKGRLVVTPLPSGDFHLEIVTKANKFAPDPVAP